VLVQVPVPGFFDTTQEKSMTKDIKKDAEKKFIGVDLQVREAGRFAGHYSNRDITRFPAQNVPRHPVAPWNAALHISLRERTTCRSPAVFCVSVDL
jgi:hypothetical protein